MDYPAFLLSDDDESHPSLRIHAWISEQQHFKLEDETASQPAIRADSPLLGRPIVVQDSKVEDDSCDLEREQALESLISGLSSWNAFKHDKPLPLAPSPSPSVDSDVTASPGSFSIPASPLQPAFGSQFSTLSRQPSVTPSDRSVPPPSVTPSRRRSAKRPSVPSTSSPESRHAVYIAHPAPSSTSRSEILFQVNASSGPRRMRAGSVGVERVTRTIPRKASSPLFTSAAPFSLRPVTTSAPISRNGSGASLSYASLAHTPVYPRTPSQLHLSSIRTPPRSSSLGSVLSSTAALPFNRSASPTSDEEDPYGHPLFFTKRENPSSPSGLSSPFSTAFPSSPNLKSIPSSRTDSMIHRRRVHTSPSTPSLTHSPTTSLSSHTPRASGLQVFPTNNELSSRWSLETSAVDKVETPTHSPTEARFPTAVSRSPEVGKVGKRQRLASFIARIGGAVPGTPTLSHTFSAPAMPTLASPTTPSSENVSHMSTLSGSTPPATPGGSPVSRSRDLLSDNEDFAPPAVPYAQTVGSTTSLGLEAWDAPSTVDAYAMSGNGRMRSGSRGSLALGQLGFGSGKKRKLVVSGLARDDVTGVEGVRAWAESFGAVKSMSRKPNGDIHINFKKQSVADMVCRVQARVYIQGAGSVCLSWFTKKRV